MSNRLSMIDLVERLPEILGRVRERGERFVIERDGEPVAALGPPDAADGSAANDATSARTQDPPLAVAESDPAVAELLAEIEAIRRDAAAGSRSTASAPTLRELAARLADLEWPDDEFADDVEAARAAMNRPIEPPEWPS